MSIEIDYTEDGDLRIRCGDEEMVWPLRMWSALQAATGGAPARLPTTPAPAPPPKTADPAAPRPTRQKVGWPKPLPGVMFITARTRRPGVPPLWPDPGSEAGPAAFTLPIENVLGWNAEDLRQRLLRQLSASGVAGSDRRLTLQVQRATLQQPIDVARLQDLVDDPSLQLDGIRLLFMPDAGAKG
jgi:hypothetical protein